MHLLGQIRDFGREMSELKLAHIQHFHAHGKRKTNTFAKNSKKIVCLPMGDAHYVISHLSFLFGIWSKNDKKRRNAATENVD